MFSCLKFPESQQSYKTLGKLVQMLLSACPRLAAKGPVLQLAAGLGELCLDRPASGQTRVVLTQGSHRIPWCNRQISVYELGAHMPFANLP